MNKLSASKLPIFMHEEITNKILKEVILSIPLKSHAYIVGGAMRNAVFYNIFKRKLPHRDYDILFIGNQASFVEMLREKKFVYGRIRKRHEIVLKKKKIPQPHGYSDYVILDIHLSDEKSIQKNLQKNANFTVNGFAIDLKNIISPDWEKKIIALPNALEDLKKKKLQVNNAFTYPSNLFSALRLMHVGFNPPPRKEIDGLFKVLRKIDKRRFDRNIKKLFSYAGGEDSARILLRKMGIKDDLFDFKIIKEL